MPRRDSSAPDLDRESSDEELADEGRFRAMTAVVAQPDPPEHHHELNEIDETVDAEALVRWLETGEGEPWGESHS